MELAQQIDIMPSILGYLNYEEPYFAFGRNVFDSHSKPYAINYLSNTYQYFADEYLLQYDDVQEKAVGLYDFKKDTLLKKNLIGKLPEIQGHLESEVKAFIQQYNYSVVNDKMQMEPRL